MHTEELYQDFLNFTKTVFEAIRDKPCRTRAEGFGNKRQYLEFENEFGSITLSSVNRSALVEDREDLAQSELVEGWCLDIVKIGFADAFQRKGYGLKFFTWLRQNTPTDFIFIQCVNTEEMRNFLVKYRDTLNAAPRPTFDDTFSTGIFTDWVIQK